MIADMIACFCAIVVICALVEVVSLQSPVDTGSTAAWVVVLLYLVGRPV